MRTDATHVLCERCPTPQLRFVRGEAKGRAPTDVGSPDIMRCLWTKWSPLDVTWEGSPPSIT